ncbi:magnesium protoporphyrin IX methyltransferase [Pararhizobium mangrovi]|uniref:Magnesium protoporphyrin IX methyltransferase n=1 Tax=Pararhizobium mangrovi TaxID=2590452 RepID=A0A506UBB3_9HYPH|nr:magnesium protoporphyrin IX methyltransferase [Pararhizobium mangrovi]TPW30421.1 magnesium protoporphyrin IX methyltransferase [Pararhizobium mangrovi]
MNALAETPTYRTRRGEIETYFDRTAADAWRKLTSDAPVSRIRATVRAGRDRMRAAMLAMLPEDLAGRRILDAGCGTGAFAFEAARRGANVTAIDLSPTLVDLARERSEADGFGDRITFAAGDMLDPALGEFDHVVAMDSVIHYELTDAIEVLSGLAARARRSVVFTHAPQTPALAAMHVVGRAFPRGDRAPSIVPVAERRLRKAMGGDRVLMEFTVGRTAKVSTGFYKSNAVELVRR